MASSEDPTDPSWKSPYPHPKETMARIKSDYRALGQDPLPGIVVQPHDDDLTLCHVLIQGPLDTPATKLMALGPLACPQPVLNPIDIDVVIVHRPLTARTRPVIVLQYANGFFYFRVRFPHNYPQESPKVTFMTTGGGRVRFNPNLYADGKVCLSLLGTWTGPGWVPTNTLSSVLISIQSIMNERPLHNEPAYEEGSSRVTDTMVSDYNSIVAHETLRVAVLGNVLDSHAMPESLRESMLPSFLEMKDFYLERCEALALVDGRPFTDPIWRQAGTFCFRDLKANIARAAEQVESGEIA